MTDQQSDSDPTTRMQRTTMNQGQEAFEQLMTLQRSMAQLTLSALRWQETAREQGMEMTRSMMNQFPGQEFTQSMLESYLDGTEAMMPEMERALERGAAAGMAAQSDVRSQSEFQRSSMPGRASGTETSGQRPSPGETGGRRAEQAGSHRMEGPSRQPRRSTGPYPQTGEWIDRQQPGPQPQSQSQGRTYGGESATATGPERHVQADRAGRMEPGPGTEPGPESGPEPREAPSRSGERSGDRPIPRHGQGQRPEQIPDRTSQQQGSSHQQGPGQRDRGEQYGQRRQQPGPGSEAQRSQRIDSEPGGPDRGEQRAGRQRVMSGRPSQQPEGTGGGHDRDRDRERTRGQGREERSGDRPRDERDGSGSGERLRETDAGSDNREQGENDAREE